MSGTSYSRSPPKSLMVKRTFASSQEVFSKVSLSDETACNHVKIDFKQDHVSMLLKIFNCAPFSFLGQLVFPMLATKAFLSEWCCSTTFFSLLTFLHCYSVSSSLPARQFDSVLLYDSLVFVVPGIPAPGLSMQLVW